MLKTGGLKLKTRSLTQNFSVVDKIAAVSPYALGRAATAARSFLSSRGFEEQLLNPVGALRVAHADAIEHPGLGQLRFNTEPEIWDSRNPCDQFYSITPLFRREEYTNPLRLQCFHILDFYAPLVPEDLVFIFSDLLKALRAYGFCSLSHGLRLDYAKYDPTQDGPATSESACRWVITDGYDQANSFYEVGADGVSSRQELFLVTPAGHLEVAALGRVGYNHNPHYHLGEAAPTNVSPRIELSGMGIGLERLVLVDKILSMI